MNQEMHVRPAALMQLPGLPSSLRNACATAAVRGGLTVGQFVSGAPEDDLMQLLGVARQAQTDRQVLMQLSLFTVMLANSEGLVVSLEDNLSTYVRRLVLMLQAELHHRDGLLVLDHDHLSLEAFDISRVPLTDKARQMGSGKVRVVQAPVPREPGAPDSRPAPG